MVAIHEIIHENELIEEGEFYRLALDPSLEHINCSQEDIVEEFLGETISDYKKQFRKESPWRERCYEPFEGFPSVDD